MPRLTVCALCSLLLHGLLLAVELPKPLKPVGREKGASGDKRMVQLRPQPKANSLPAQIARGRWLSSSAQATDTARSDVLSSAKIETLLAEGTDVSRDSVPIDEPAVPAGLASTFASAGGDDFFPRPLLTVPPKPIAAVTLAAPPPGMEATRYLGVLSLYIDELGQVQHVEAHEPFFPAALEAIARGTFMAVPFSPGQVDGRAVKSRLRVEVEFDNTPLAIR
jgi:hypothetical protein